MISTYNMVHAIETAINSILIHSNENFYYMLLLVKKFFKNDIK